MDSENTSSLLPNPAFQTHPELLMAGRCGDWERLEHLLSHIKSVAGDDSVDVEMSSATAIAPAEALTAAGDTLLHVVASRGDAEEFLKSATVVYGKASHLLDARNKHGDTPLHCASRAGCRGMLSHLLALARAENDGDKVKGLLRVQNGRGETALHEAVRLGDGDMLRQLMAEDPQLARVPSADGHGASPLYLAVELGRDDIARQLYGNDPALSYSGPDGRNVLHAAVLKGQDTTKMLLEWNKDLIKEADRSTGSTPLHLAASWGKHKVMSLLLAADASAAYQPDLKGLFPVHVAAFSDNVKAVSVLLDRRHDCADLRDAIGRTFLHVAVQEDSQAVVTYACNAAPSVINMQDDDGNTALHLAVEVGDLWIFNPLMENRSVALNVTNNKGQTPLDLSWISAPAGLSYGTNSRIKILQLLRHAGARNGTHRSDVFYKIHIAKLDEKEEAQKITTSTQIIIVSSVLIATVAFAAAFTLPGGYWGGDQKNGGTPVLVGHSAFHVFIIADTLSFIFSGLSIALLTYAGIVSIDIRTRMVSLAFASGLMIASARSLSAAFVFGLYVVLAPVARTTAVASFAITALACADAIWSIWLVCTAELTLLKRLGARAWWRLARAILVTLLSQFWPYIVIAGVVKCVKIK